MEKRKWKRVKGSRERGSGRGMKNKIIMTRKRSRFIYYLSLKNKFCGQNKFPKREREGIYKNKYGIERME